MTRWQQILSGLLVLQLLLTAVVFWPDDNASAGGGPLFPDLVTENVAGITITGSDNQQVVLVRQNGSWLLASGGNYPADPARIEPVLAKIAGIQLSRLVAQTTASQKRLKVADDDFENRVRLELIDGSTQTFYLGSSPNFRSIHIRRAGADAVYLISDLNSGEISAELRNWIDTQYFQVARDEIVSLSLTNDNGTFDLQKDENGVWTLVGLGSDELFNEARLNSILARLSNMTLTAPLGTENKPEYGLNNPAAVLTVVTAGEDGEQTRILQVSAPDPADDSYVMKWSESDFYVRTAAFNGNDLVQSTRADFSQQPTPAPATSSEATPAPGS